MCELISPRQLLFSQKYFLNIFFHHKLLVETSCAALSPIVSFLLFGVWLVPFLMSYVWIVFFLFFMFGFYFFHFKEMFGSYLYGGS